MTLGLFDTTAGTVLVLIGITVALGIGFVLPGWSGKIIAALVLALPFLTIALMVAIAQGFMEAMTGREFGLLSEVLTDAMRAAVFGGVLAVIGSLFTRLKGAR